MKASDRPPRWDIRRSIFASVVLHLIVGIAILIFSPNKVPLEPTEDETITVELVAPKQFETARPGTATARKVLPTALKKPPAENRQKETALLPARPKLAVPSQKSTMVQATKLYAATMLAAPRARKTRAALRKLGTQEKMIQLCNIEAMEQIARWDKRFRPEYVIAYAMSDPALSASTVDANGAAFRSRKHRYNLEFKCALTPDIASVSSFEFRVEAEIPKGEWLSHNLTADDGPDD
ncbi:MAG: hypothetical protein JWM58_4284 [Rhizobium sp.]|nr:hypothetical protein [Rhizobium sp.]